jgi:hypothetical protein
VLYAVTQGRLGASKGRTAALLGEAKGWRTSETVLYRVRAVAIRDASPQHVGGDALDSRRRRLLAAQSILQENLTNPAPPGQAMLER